MRISQLSSSEESNKKAYNSPSCGILAGASWFTKLRNHWCELQCSHHLCTLATLVSSLMMLYMPEVIGICVICHMLKYTHIHKLSNDRYNISMYDSPLRFNYPCWCFPPINWLIQVSHYQDILHLNFPVGVIIGVQYNHPLKHTIFPTHWNLALIPL